MNNHLSNRLRELESEHANIDRPIRFIWVDAGEDSQSRLAEAASQNPNKKIAAIRWLGD
jgi:hypothetical protein